MEPIKINVNIEVGLKQTTLEALAQIFGAKTAPQPEPKRTETEEGPQPQPEAPTPLEDDDDDLPPADASSPKKTTPTEDDARQAVKAARLRGVSAKTIKDYMNNEFGIASSVECPAERRQELIDGLNNLAA